MVGGNPQPLDFAEARISAHRLAQQRRQGLVFLEESVKGAADAKLAYRKALSIAHVSAQGATAAAKDADARDRASEAEHALAVAEGMVKVAHEKLASIDGERASLHRLIDWTIRVSPLGEAA